MRDLLDWSKRREDEIEERKNQTDYILYGTLGATVVLPIVLAGAYSMYNKPGINNAKVEEIPPEENMIEAPKRRYIEDYYTDYSSEGYTSEDYTPVPTPRRKITDKKKSKGKGKTKARQ